MIKGSPLAVVVASVLMYGCASQPKLAAPLTMPSVPLAEDSFVEAELKVFDDSQLADNVVQLSSHAVSANSSVVINVPASLFEDQSDSQTNNQDFKTKDFFNEAEQQIEKELMRNGFRVLSRSKFEAKLRELRDESRCDLSNYDCLRSSVSPDVKPVLEELKAKFDRGDLSATRYAEQVRDIRSQMQMSSAGRSRNGDEKELTDISEVIRAAQDGEIRSDYILQINIFDTEKQKKLMLDLRHDDQIRAFVRNNPGIADEFTGSPSKHQISCAVIEASLNAKLVHVKTGEIAWIGEHSLNEFSSGVQSVSVELGQRHYVSNAAEVENFVRSQNRYSAREARYGRSVEVPEFTYADKLLGPDVSGGSCNQSWSTSNEVKLELARKVARELISTIAIGE
jgi:hypothetical protein